MNKTKFIHIIAVALVFCSQLAASVHVTNHLQQTIPNADSPAAVHNHNHSHGFVQHDSSHPCHHKAASFKPSKAVLAEDCQRNAQSQNAPSLYVVSHAASDDDLNHEAIDCLGFHLLLNLGGAFLQVQKQAHLPLQFTDVSLVPASAIVASIADHHRIRAPPVTS